MKSTLAIAIYAPFALITVVVLVLELFRGFKRQEDYLFNILCFCVASWFASDIASILTGNYALLRFLYNVKLIFVGLVPPVLLLFVLRFYKVELGRYRRPLLWLLFLIPMLNIAVVLTSAWHTWMVDIELTAWLPYRQFTIHWGPWFWVHTVQSYLVSVAIISVVVIRHFRLPHFYRLPSTLMGVGIFISLGGNMITLVQLFPPLIDPTLITCSLSLILFDLAIINNNKSKFVRFSHKRVYHYLDEYILILDETQRVLDYNQPAEQWFNSQGITLKEAAFSDIIAALLAQEDAEQKPAEDQKSSNLYLLGGDFPVVLNLHLHQITDAKDDVIGAIAVFTDITQTWALIEKLEEKAGVDSLTGIPNHLAYVGAKSRFDTPAYLPLSVVMCDANDLKKANDTLGHQYGDLMLQVAAELLEQECSARGQFAARIGGDEFICLMPQTSAEEALRQAGQMQQALAAIKQYPFNLSMAMGVATKQCPEEDLDEVIAVADDNMYENKKLLKGA